MQIGTRRTRVSSLLIAGLFVLAGVFFDMRSASAQTPEPCPLPPGVTLPEDLAVTAQQVEAGTASLKDFALAVKDQFTGGSGAGSRELQLYVGCLLRHDGSPFHSGSTYLVQLTPDGRLFTHAKNMALSGRLLNRLIYGGILRALQINVAGLQNDPAALTAAFIEAAGRDGGAFNIPGIPGASGYATVYFSTNFRLPFVLLAGFDINDAHLAEEDIEYVTPAVTARDVVDRETLKTFVTQAGEAFLTSQKGGDLSATSRARVVFRDPDGPWRHGSVYLYVLDLTSNIILFHGAFPDRFELRPLIATLRDAVTGELILPQVIEAAKSDPEGGFVEYFFDDPDDDTDRDDIPKVGYARQFTGERERADGTKLPINFIVGSGFYGRAPDEVTTGPCTLPHGVTLPEDLAVTAQQVEAGTASLKDFALAVKDQFTGGSGAGSRELQLYVGCLLRHDGSPFHSGSTYLVQLTPDGRLFTHAKNMALSGRLLNRLIYGGILRALQINVAGLQNDPAALTAAFIEAAGRDGGAFNIPGIPGASGYATVYFSTNFRLPFVLLAGFDINDAHLAEEDIEYVTPAVTARDVVDRETLKTFVTQAGEAFLTSQKGGDLSATSRARVVFRDPDGPWRHGSVYLYVLDLTSNIILFHGAFPDRFELRPLIATLRDAVTGELILPQVIEAAKSDPEGGFVEYFFDDPDDDTDRDDIPKVGYARQFTGERERADGTKLPVNFIVGSGFYGRAPGADYVPDITLAVNPATLSEGAGAQTVTVTVTQSNTAVPVATEIPLTLGGTASGEDYSVSGDLNVTIPAWGTEGSTELTFTIVDDTVYESGGETIVVTASYNGQDLDSATLAITDSYAAPAAVGTPRAVTLEAGDSETVDAGPLFSGTDLSFSASSSDNGVVDAVMTAATLTVTGARKGTATVTVAARNAAGEASLAVNVTVTAVAAEREAYTNILAAMGRGMLSGVSATIGGRFGAGGHGQGVVVGGRSIGGLASGISALTELTGHRRQAASKEMALFADSERRRAIGGDYLLRTSSFSYALEDHTASGGLRWSVWGAGDLQNYQGEPGEGASYDGDLRTAYIGFDVATQRSWLAGVALSRAMGQSDYDVTVASGSLESRLTAVLPYLRWKCVTGLTEVWSIVGLGAGEVEVEDGTSDLSMRMGILGARSRLASSGGLGLDVVGDAGLLRLSTSDSESAALSDIATDVQRIRIGLEGSRATTLAGGTTVTPYAQVAGRYDGGDGQTGQGLEVSGGLRLTGGRVGLDARGRFLAVHTAEEYSENGVSLVAYLRANTGGQGLSMSVAPRMGAGTRESGMMWRDRPLAGADLRGGRPTRSLQAEVGYGLASSSTGLLFTPFGDLYLDRDERRRLRLGARIGAADLVSRIGSLELSGARIDRRGGETDHRIGLVGSMSF